MALDRSLTVTFKAKPETRWNTDDGSEYQALAVPALERRHCNMQAFRISRRFGGFANSDMFPAMLRRVVQGIVGERMRVRLDRPLPEGVTVAPGFLHVVTITFQDS